MSRARLLDLFCGAGGAAAGYHRAGFDVVGVDIKPQPNYPFEFHQGDAMTWSLDGFDAIHASPPCQGYSAMRHLPWLADKEYPLLIEPVRERLLATGLPYVIENVERAPIARHHGGIVLCGLSFGLPLYRHRRFESNVLLLAPQHERHPEVIWKGRKLGSRYHATGGAMGVVSVAGYSGPPKAVAEAAMGIDWMTRDELTQAAFTEFIGHQILAALERAA